jgi:hypothetical protein
MENIFSLLRNNRTKKIILCTIKHGLLSSFEFHSNKQSPSCLPFLFKDVFFLLDPVFVNEVIEKH